MYKNTIYESYYEYLYNPQLKIKFIEENYFKNEKTKKIIVDNFKKSAKSEFFYGKDLCVMSLKEVNDVIEGLGYVSEITIGTAVSYFKSYVDWCIVNNLRGSHENGINNIAIFQATQDMSKFVSRIKNKHRYITKDELINAIKYTENFPDKALLIGLYEGIAGEELHELRSLKIEDVNLDTNQVTLIDIDGKKRTKTISKELVNILFYANTQEERLIGNKSTLYADTIYIIKPVIRKEHNKDNMITYNTLSARFQSLKRNIGLDFITPLSVQVSGQIKRIEELTEKYNLDKPNDAVFDELMLPTEYNLTQMQVYNLKRKYRITTELKSFK